MREHSYSTPFIKKQERKICWWLVDVAGKPIGRISSTVAFLLQGKNRVDYVSNFALNHVIVINVEKAFFTGKKEKKKNYISYTGYPGGQRSINVEQLRIKKPEDPMRRAIKGMLPKNRLGRSMLRHLHIYKGEEHPYQNQQIKIATV